MDSHAVRLRFIEIMRRHIRLEDAKLSDDQLVRAVFERYERERRQPIVDVNE